MHHCLCLLLPGVSSFQSASTGIEGSREVLSRTKRASLRLYRDSQGSVNRVLHQAQRPQQIQKTSTRDRSILQKEKDVFDIG